MVEEFDKQVLRYDSSAYHDATGIGNVVEDYISSPAEGITMVGRRRKDMLTEYIAAIERGDVVAPMIEFMYNEHKTASVEMVYGNKHLPDSFAAGALAFYGFSYAGDLGFLI